LKLTHEQVQKVLAENMEANKEQRKKTTQEIISIVQSTKAMQKDIGGQITDLKHKDRD
jgi:hypothetical protein